MKWWHQKALVVDSFSQEVGRHRFLRVSIVQFDRKRVKMEVGRLLIMNSWKNGRKIVFYEQCCFYFGEEVVFEVITPLMGVD